MAEGDNGRPRIIETPEEFERLVEEYRLDRKNEERPLTFAGMARHLGFADRRSFYDYAKRDGFSLSVKKAQILIEEQYEENLSGNNVAGSIFALKNHGWSDKQELAHTGGDGPPIAMAITRTVVDPHADS